MRASSGSARAAGLQAGFPRRSGAPPAPRRPPDGREPSPRLPLRPQRDVGLAGRQRRQRLLGHHQVQRRAREPLLEQAREPRQLRELLAVRRSEGPGAGRCVEALATQGALQSPNAAASSGAICSARGVGASPRPVRTSSVSPQAVPEAGERVAHRGLRQVQPAGRPGCAPLLEHQVEDAEEVGIDVGEVHGRDDDYHQTSLALESPARATSARCAGRPSLFLLLAACAHAPGGALPHPGEPRDTGRGGRGPGILGRLLGAPGPDGGDAGPLRAGGDNPRAGAGPGRGRGRRARGKARLEAELALVLAEEFLYGRSGAERGVQLAQAAQASARTLRLPDVEAQALHAEGYLRYGEALWAEVKRATSRPPGSGSPVPGTSSGRPTMLRGSRRRRSSSASPRSRRGKLERAEPLYAEALRRAEEIGDRATQAYALRHLAGVSESRGDLDQALALHRRCLALREGSASTAGSPTP